LTQEPIQNINTRTTNNTPFGATKTAELDVQFSMDPSFGLTRQQYGWYSNGTLFDSTHFTEGNGQIEIETSATANDFARLRSAYPGSYVSHTFAEPGIGAAIPEEYLEYDTSGRGETVSLTHGEISIGAFEVDEAQDSDINTHALSFESDGVYAQVRKNNENVVFVRQENWNIDPMDGTGPSGQVLRPEEGHIYNFPFTWYGHGALYIFIQDPLDGKMIPVHRARLEGDVSLGTANMPVEVAVQNLDNAQSLGVNVGGMQWATHGAARLADEEQGRTSEASRVTGTSFISDEVVLSNNEVDPFAEPGVPLVSMRRDINDVESRTTLSVSVNDFFANVSSDVWIFVFDEYDEENTLTNENFRETNIVQNGVESRVQVDTQATEYTPGPNATIRGMAYIVADNKSTQEITGDTSSRLPIEATVVCTAVLATGSNSTGARPFTLEVQEGY
jgi:hypothetical protein